jgi:hypothetical protein
MKIIFTLLLILLAGCSVSDFIYYFNGVSVYPEFEWIEPPIFQNNLKSCGQQLNCSVDLKWLGEVSGDKLMEITERE